MGVSAVHSGMGAKSYKGNLGGSEHPTKGGGMADLAAGTGGGRHAVLAPAIKKPEKAEKAHSASSVLRVAFLFLFGFKCFAFFLP